MQEATHFRQQAPTSVGLGAGSFSRGSSRSPFLPVRRTRRIPFPCFTQSSNGQAAPQSPPLFDHVRTREPSQTTVEAPPVGLFLMQAPGSQTDGALAPAENDSKLHEGRDCTPPWQPQPWACLQQVPNTAGGTAFGVSDTRKTITVIKRTRG